VRTIFLFLVLFPEIVLAQMGTPALGMWREHLPYQSAVDVTASDKKVYCATPFSLFSVDIATNEVERMSRVSGLSETGVSTIQYDPLSKKLFIAYTNSNIDVLDAKGIHNIPDIKRDNISGDKNVYHIYPDNDRCYLSTGLGVIVLDAMRHEVKQSWFIGNNGLYVKTNGFTKSNGFFYAATEEGLKKISVNNSSPADFRNWQTHTSVAAKAVVNFQNKIILLQNDSLFIENGPGLNSFYADGWPVLSINISQNKLLVCQRKSTGESRVLHLDESGVVQKIIQQAGVVDFPKKAISVGNDYWIADLFGSLIHWNGNSAEQYKLNSPENIATAEMTVFRNVFYAAAGSVNDAWNYQYNVNGTYRLKDGTWKTFNRFQFPQLDSLNDIVTLAVDPRDETVWSGSFGGGLLHIKNNNALEIFKQASPLLPTPGDPGSYRVSGLAFDGDNNLWISNFGSPRQLHVLKNDGTWRSFNAPFFINENAVAKILIDDRNQKWIISPLNNGVIVYDHGLSIDNAGDDKWRMYKQGAGNGSLPSGEVFSIAKDKNGFIWIGTADGVAIIQCPQEAFTANCEAILPVIKEGGFANYLFKGQSVKSIVVDGADRKWMATSNGVWLISAEGDKVLAHFTEDNSPLLSNDIRTIAINGKNGEVFFGTAKGIISFRGAATEAAEDQNNLLVYPNPVPPGYTGTIGIKGLPENSLVKIAEMNGRLVYQTRSLGGQAVWNGKDYKNNSVSTGIYLVIVVDENKQEKAVGKIVFVSK